MIKVERSRVPVPECLRTDIDSKGKRETEKAKSHFRKKAVEEQAAAGVQPSVVLKTTERTRGKKGNARSETFTFSAYKDAKPALEKLFNNKCGYCEINYGGAPSDVEHFRPKGGIDYEDQGSVRKYTEGYYWLAADWENLIFSCQHCNRGETHDHQDWRGARLDTRVSGKANFFPLSDESKRLKACEPVDEEEPYRLLLDPCRDEPSDHLRFHSDGLVTAKIIGSRPSPHGMASIRHYGLSRVALIDRRKETANKLLFAVQQLNAQLTLVQKEPSAAHRTRVAEIVRHIRTEFLTQPKPFLGMAWALFRQYANMHELSAAMRKPTQHPPSEEMESVAN